MQFTATSIFLGLAAVVAASNTGKMTYYNPSVGTGACGWNNADTDYVLAISGDLWTASNPNNDPLCGQQVAITYGGTTVYAEVVDKCPSTECDSTHIDVSPAVFTEFAAESVGTLQVTWDWVKCDCYPSCGCTGGDWCYCQYDLTAGDAPCAPNCGCTGGAYATCGKPTSIS